jgi:hypothetical protein
MGYLITGELYSVAIYMNYLNTFLCETNLAKITIFYFSQFQRKMNIQVPFQPMNPFFPENSFTKLALSTNKCKKKTI